jgi:outer membrane protein, heavy metal efflux system
MRLLVAALAVCLLVPCLPARGDAIAAAGSTLALEAALARAVDANPELRAFELRRAALSAERERAALDPARTLGASLDNAPGTGAFAGFRSAEFTVSLAGVLERGGKRDAREAVARGRLDALTNEREAQRLDLLAETARRYLALVAATRQRVIAETDIAQRERAVAAARIRLNAGASPESVVLTAGAALARAQLDRDRAAQRFDAARRHLAALWGESEPAFAAMDVEPTALPLIEDVGALQRIVEDSPDLARFADERRIREARLQLARADATADLDWSIGVRRLEADDDVALVGSIAVPLGARARAQPGLRAAAAELETLALEREAKAASLRSTLIEAHGRYRVARLEVLRYRDDILPQLDKAGAAAERAYRAGAISYLEWAQVQSESTAARRQQLDAALDAQRALIELQRLTAEPFVIDAAPATDKGEHP